MIDKYSEFTSKKKQLKDKKLALKKQLKDIRNQTNQVKLSELQKRMSNNNVNVAGPSNYN